MTQYINFIKIFEKLDEATNSLTDFNIFTKILYSNNIQYYQAYTPYDHMTRTCDSVILASKFKDNSIVLYSKIELPASSFSQNVYYYVVIDYDDYDELINICQRTLKMKAFL